MWLGPVVDGVEFDSALELDVLGSVLDVDLVFDDLLEVDWGHTVDDQVGLDLTTETTTVVLTNVFILNVVDDKRSGTTLLNDFVLITDAGLVKNFFTLGGGDFLPGNLGGVLGEVSVENNGVTTFDPGITEVASETDWSETVNAKISGAGVVVVSADAVHNAGIGLGNLIDNEDALGSNSDNVELVVGLDLGLLPVAKVPVNFSFHFFDFGDEEGTRASIHPLILNFELEWLSSLEFKSSETSGFFESFEAAALSIHGILSVENVLERLTRSDEA